MFTYSRRASGRRFAILIYKSLIGEALVAIGVILEIEPPLTTKKILSFAAVVIGVVVGAAGTLLLLNFDESISRRQQDKIIALATRLAPRILDDADKERLRALHGKVPALAFMATGGVEPAYYSAQLQAELHDHDEIQIRPYPSNPATLTMGTQICFPTDYTAAAKSLVLAAFTEDGREPGECKFADFDSRIPQDIPLVVIGERPFAYLDTQDSSSIRIRYYPELGKLLHP